jgi:hypothetical protein
MLSVRVSSEHPPELIVTREFDFVLSTILFHALVPVSFDPVDDTRDNLLAATRKTDIRCVSWCIFVCPDGVMYS